MAKGREKDLAYREALSGLGKSLARRARSKCELSGEPGTLVTVDLRPDDRDPTLETVVLVAPTVAENIGGRGLDGPLHYLNDAVWSPEPAVRHAAEKILKQIDAPWARDALDNIRLMDTSQESEG